MKTHWLRSTPCIKESNLDPIRSWLVTSDRESEHKGPAGYCGSPDTAIEIGKTRQSAKFTNHSQRSVRRHRGIVFQTVIRPSHSPATFEVAMFWLCLVLVLNEMVLVLVLDAAPPGTSTANAEYEHEYEKCWGNTNWGSIGIERRNFKTSYELLLSPCHRDRLACSPINHRLGCADCVFKTRRFDAADSTIAITLSQQQ
jgi:hypothetical protein